MVEVIQTECADHLTYGGGRPLLHLHTIERHVFGNSISVHVYGEMKIAAGERVWAKEMKLKTIQVLNMTCEIPHRQAHGYIANKYIYHKGEYGNWASIDVFDDAGNWGSRGQLPADGSIWIDFEAVGE